jgi:tetratricopeptide (TPR) repeat protein
VLFDELKKYGAALEHFEAAARLAPENVEVLANFASTLTSLAKYERAEEMLRRAQRLSPEDVQARLGIGILYFRRGLYAQAEVELAWVCSREENNGGAYYYRGEALNRLGRFDEAVLTLERAAELIPTDPRPFYTLGHLYDRRHQLEDAAEMYRRARTLQHP